MTQLPQPTVTPKPNLNHPPQPPQQRLNEAIQAHRQAEAASPDLTKEELASLLIGQSQPPVSTPPLQPSEAPEDLPSNVHPMTPVPPVPTSSPPSPPQATPTEPPGDFLDDVEKMPLTKPLPVDDII